MKLCRTGHFGRQNRRKLLTLTLCSIFKDTFKFCQRKWNSWEPCSDVLKEHLLSCLPGLCLPAWGRAAGTGTELLGLALQIRHQRMPGRAPCPALPGLSGTSSGSCGSGRLPCCWDLSPGLAECTKGGPKRRTEQSCWARRGRKSVHTARQEPNCVLEQELSPYRNPQVSKA